MSYRTNTYICIRPYTCSSNYGVEFKRDLATLSLLPNSPLNKLKQIIRSHKEDFDKAIISGEQLLFYMTGWRWNNEIEAVNALEDLWEHFRKLEDKKRFNGCFLQYGDEDTDITEMYINNGHKFGEVIVSRKIHIYE